MDNNRRFLKTFFAALSLAMVYLAISTSLKSNFFEVLPDLNRQPWFVTTIYDFYFNIAILAAWVFYREPSRLKAALWVIGFICLGSIATCFYVFLQLQQLRPQESLDKALVKKG